MFHVQFLFALFLFHVALFRVAVVLFHAPFLFRAHVRALVHAPFRVHVVRDHAIE